MAQKLNTVGHNEIRDSNGQRLEHGDTLQGLDGLTYELIFRDGQPHTRHKKTGIIEPLTSFEKTKTLIGYTKMNA